MATAADTGDFKELLLQQLQRDEAVEALLEAAAPAASVSLETRIKLAYFSEPAADFHVSFSFLGKQYNADFVSAWEVLSRKRADNAAPVLRGQQQQYQQQQPQSQLVHQQHHQPLQLQAQQNQQQQQSETHFQQNQPQLPHHQQPCVPRVRVQMADAVVTFGETPVNASPCSSIGRSIAGGNTNPPCSVSSLSSSSSSPTTSSSSSSSSTLASSSAAYPSTVLARETSTVSSVMLEEASSQRELITAATTVPLDTLCFTWALIQQVADAVLSVSVGRTIQDKEKPVAGELMPRACSTPATAVPQQQQQQNEAQLASKKSARGDLLLSAAVKNKEKCKSKLKETKPIPLFDVFQKGDLRVGRLLLLANDDCLHSAPAFNAQISQLNGIHDFSIEVWCNQAPLSQNWRALLNPICITFLEARDIPLPLPSTQPGQQQNQHKQPPQEQQPVAALSEKESLYTLVDNSGLLQLPESSSGETLAGVYLEVQWLRGTKFTTPVRPLQLYQTSPHGSRKGGEKFRRARATWEHDVICFCGPALLNPSPFYQYLESIPLHVELHQTSDMLRQQGDAQEALRSPRKRRILPQSAADGGGGEAVCFSSGSAGPHSGRAGKPALSPGAAARASTLPRQSTSPQKGILKASTLKAATDGRGARRTQATSSQGRRGRVTSSDMVPEKTNVLPAHGAADFDLRDLCRLRLKYLELVSDVYPVSVKAAKGQASEDSELEKTIPTAAALLSSPLEAFHAATTKIRRTPTPYLEFGTQIMLRIQLAEPIARLTTTPQNSFRGEIDNVAEDSDERRATALTEKADLCFEPFGLVVGVADASQKQLFTAVTKFVESHNMRTLKLESLDALHLEMLHADNPSHATLDVLTGFILSDGRRHVLVAEGLRGQGLQHLWSILKREENALFWKKLLYNPCIGFSRRFYTAFHLRLRWIRLQTPLEALLQQPLLLDSSTVEAQQVAAALDQLAALLRAARMREAKLAKSFPSAAGLMQLSHLHGEDEESEDSLVRAHGQKPIETLAAAS